MARVSLVVAIARNGVIGDGGKLPWRIPEDLKRFKDLTMGKTVVMGRRTWESLPEKYRPLPGRRNVVVTRNAGYPLPEGVERFGSVAEAVAAHASEDEVMLIGGVGVYTEGLGIADTLYVTHVHKDADGDVRLDIPFERFAESGREDRDGFSFVTYQRRK